MSSNRSNLTENELVVQIHKAAKELQLLIYSAHQKGINTHIRIDEIKDCSGEGERPEIWVTTSKILRPTGPGSE